MADPVVLHADGAHGEAIAQAKLSFDDDFRIYDIDGIDAPEAYPGAPGKTFTVALSEADKKGDFVATLLVGEGLPRRTYVPRGQRLLLTSRGGDGQKGGRGGDGRRGHPGLNGQDASRSADGTNGGQGAQGGSAGRGTDGGRGGNGGDIHVLVKDDQMHLLIAVDIDVSGGRGGVRGKHGQPGPGGYGGKGGKSYSWETFRAYENGTPKYDKHFRRAGTNGGKGNRGRSHNSILNSGENGRSGTIKWLVKWPGFDQPIGYRTRYQLRLKRFHIEDENKDGIFEPREEVIVNQIQVENVGEMPSPRNIPISLRHRSSFRLQRYRNDICYIDMAIEPKSCFTISGILTQTIPEDPTGVGNLERPYSSTITIGLVATMPWLNTPIPGFDQEKTINISYPLQMESQIEFLKTIMEGSEIAMPINVQSCGSRPFGTSSKVRAAEVHIIISQHATLFDGEDYISPEREQAIVALNGRDRAHLEQLVRIDRSVPPYSRAVIIIELLISPPLSIGPCSLEELVTIQRTRTEFQICEKFSHHPAADALLVTNFYSTSSMVRRFKYFLADGLGLVVDTFNYSLTDSYCPSEIIGDIPMDNVLKLYRGKTIVFFGFQLPSGQSTLDAKTRCPSLSTCDYRVLSDLALHGTAFLFLHLAQLKSLHHDLKPIVHPLHNKIQPELLVPDDVALHLGIRKVKNAIHAQLYLDRPAMKLHLISFKPNRLAPKWLSLRATQREVRHTLDQAFPHQHFSICVERERGSVYVFIFHGLPRATVLNFTKMVGDEFSSEDSRLNNLERYRVIQALPIARRLHMQLDMVAHVSQLVVFTIIQDLMGEVSRFCAVAKWPSRPDRLDAMLSSHLALVLLVLRTVENCPPGHLSAGLRMILQYLLAFCQPQRKRSIFTTAILRRLHRRRNLFNFLQSIIRKVLKKTLSEREIKDFFYGAKNVHSSLSRKRRATDHLVLSKLATITGTSINVLRDHFAELSTSVPHVECLNVDGWNKVVDTLHYQNLQVEAAKIKHEESRFERSYRSQYDDSPEASESSVYDIASEGVLSVDAMNILGYEEATISTQSERARF